MSCAEVGVS